jgi:hypothetical protein
MPTPMVVATPQIFPAKCVSCGCGHNTDGRRFVDLGASAPRYGAIYFCEHCIKEAYATLNVPEPVDIDLVSAAHQRIIELEDINARLRRSLSELDFLGSRGSADLAESPVAAEAGETKPAQRVAAGSAKTKSTGKTGPAKPTNGGGSTGVQRHDPLAILGESTSF